jgi:hypothetical protein
MSATYFATLKQVKGLEHEALVNDQRRWLITRNFRCSIDDVADCLRKATQSRKDYLEKFEHFARPVINFDLQMAVGTTGGQFAGDWSDCDITSDGGYICEFRKLFQNKSRVCGWWLYWATSQYYGGRLVGTADGNKLSVTAICGRQGGETQHECPQWESAKKSLHLCGDKQAFLVDGEVECARAVEARLALSKFSYDPRADTNLASGDPDDPHNGWIKSCLAEDNYLASTVPREQ